MREYPSEDITLRRGDSMSFTVYVTQGCPAEPRNITGSTTRFGAKHAFNDLGYVIDVTGTIEDTAGGRVSFTIPSSATAAVEAPAVLVYDVQFEEGDTSVTLQSGRLTILPETTS